MGRYYTPPRLDPTDNKEEALDALSTSSEHAAERAKVFATLALVDELRAIRELLEKRFSGDISDAP